MGRHTTRRARTAADMAEGEDARKLVVTLVPRVARYVRKIADKYDISYARVVEYALQWLDIEQNLGPNERLVIQNTKTGEIESMRIVPPLGSKSF